MNEPMTGITIGATAGLITAALLAIALCAIVVAIEYPRQTRVMREMLEIEQNYDRDSRARWAGWDLEDKHLTARVDLLEQWVKAHHAESEKPAAPPAQEDEP